MFPPNGTLPSWDDVCTPLANIALGGYLSLSPPSDICPLLLVEGMGLGNQ